ncbi:hypothetical protein [Paenibacillus sp.]|uniref:hypothetical protein n=1 Tax=Paenibacillus sp. TaxID=58172 RepID=UPI00281281A0|nr:hypothetical protein [Paenibacillus sp.]
MGKKIRFLSICLLLAGSVAGCAATSQNEGGAAPSAELRADEPAVIAEATEATEAAATNIAENPTPAMEAETPPLVEAIRWTIEDEVNQFDLDVDRDGTAEVIRIHEPSDFLDPINVEIETSGGTYTLEDEFYYDNWPTIDIYDINADGRIEIIFNDGYRAGDYINLVTFTGQDFLTNDAQLEGRVQHILDNQIVTDIATYTFTADLALEHTENIAVAEEDSVEAGDEPLLVTITFPENDLSSVLDAPDAERITEITIDNPVEFRLEGFSSLPNVATLRIADITVVGDLPELTNAPNLQVIYVGNESDEGDVEYFLRGFGLSNDVDFIYADGEKNLFQSVEE